MLQSHVLRFQSNRARIEPSPCLWDRAFGEGVMMPTITIHDIPANLYDRLKAVAQAHHRTISEEVIACIKQRVRTYKVDPEIEIARARRLRALTKDHPITDDKLDAAKKAGRP